MYVLLYVCVVLYCVDLLLYYVRIIICLRFIVLCWLVIVLCIESSTSQSARSTAAPTPIGSRRCLAVLMHVPLIPLSTSFYPLLLETWKLLWNPINELRLFSPSKEQNEKINIIYITFIRFSWNSIQIPCHPALSFANIHVPDGHNTSELIRPVENMKHSLIMLFYKSDMAMAPGILLHLIIPHSKFL
jgi:hypothetical protein